MEMVLRLRKHGMSEIRWERGIRVCLLLALSCILYYCVGMDSADYRAKTEDTVVYGQEIKQNGSMCDGYTEHIYKNAKKTFALYGWEQENAAAHRLADQREHTGITERMKRLETRKSRMTQDFGSLSEVSQEREIPIIENISIIENASFIDYEEEIKNNIPVMEEETEGDIPIIKEEMKGDIPYVEEETEGDSSYVENEEEEGDTSFVQEEDTSTEENSEIREIAGFFVDNHGYIVGVTEALSFTDGILAIASDSECVGIKGNAFADVEADVFEIYIPANICEIESGAFDVFSNLMYIEVSEESLYYYSMDGILYSKSGKEIAYPAGR